MFEDAINGKRLKWYVDYGYHVGYPLMDYGTTESAYNPAALNDNMAGGFIIMADAPSKDVDPTTASMDFDRWNHRADMVNALSAGSSVTKIKPQAPDPNEPEDLFFIIQGDDIYQSWAGKMVYYPSGSYASEYGSVSMKDSGSEKAALYPNGKDDQVIYSPKAPWPWEEADDSASDGSTGGDTGY